MSVDKQQIYNALKGLDRNRDGKITIADATTFVSDQVRAAQDEATPNGRLILLGFFCGLFSAFLFWLVVG